MTKLGFQSLVDVGFRISDECCVTKNLNRARDLIIHDPAHHGANGAAMPTDEGDQDGHFLFNHPERGDYPAA
jgi:hypothetical protein